VIVDFLRLLRAALFHILGHSLAMQLLLQCYFGVVGCLEEPQTLEQYACEGTKLYISCGAVSEIHVVDANYGRTENAICGTSNDNCYFNATCIVKKWFAFELMMLLEVPIRGLLWVLRHQDSLF